VSGEAPKDLDTRREETLGAISSASDPGTLEEVRVRTLGKSGWLTEKLKELGKLAAEQRKEAGALLNRAREEFQEFIEKKRTELEQARIAARSLAGASSSEPPALQAATAAAAMSTRRSEAERKILNTP